MLAAFRNAGVSLQHIRAVVAILEREIGIEHALASRRLYTDGAVILYRLRRREERRRASRSHRGRIAAAGLRAGRRGVSEAHRVREGRLGGDTRLAGNAKADRRRRSGAVVRPTDLYPRRRPRRERGRPVASGRSAGRGRRGLRSADGGRRGHPACRTPRRRLSSSSTAASGDIASPRLFALRAGSSAPTTRSYGERDEDVPDVEWLEFCSAEGLVVSDRWTGDFGTGPKRSRRSAGIA